MSLWQRSQRELKLLFGVETEYHVLIFDEDRRVQPRKESVELFAEALRARVAGVSLSHGRWDWTLANGSRVYFDSNSRIEAGGAFEHATAEHTDLISLIADVRGGQRLMLEVATEVENSGWGVEVYTSGVDSLTGDSTGTHLSYWRPVKRPARELSPHFASLPPISGTGGFSCAAGFPGLEFVFSPRAELIEKPASSSSSDNRGLVDTYRKPLCGEQYGWRIQDINGETNHSDIQLAVRVGSTALLMALLDGDLICLDDLQLERPVAAVRAFNRNANVPQGLADGRILTALDLQSILCDRAANALADGAIESPPWSDWLIQNWRRLIRLAGGDGEVTERTCLDWVVVKTGLREICDRNGIEWGTLSTVQRALRYAQCFGLDWQEIDRLPRNHSARWALDQSLKSEGMSWKCFQTILEVIPELHAFCTSSLRVGPAGLLQLLRDQGVVPVTDIVDQEQITSALSEPPAMTRAKIRGAFVRDNVGKKGYAARWDQLLTPFETIDLPDPFEKAVGQADV